jgi:hypothetical protein
MQWKTTTTRAGVWKNHCMSVIDSPLRQLLVYSSPQARVYYGSARQRPKLSKSNSLPCVYGTRVLLRSKCKSGRVQGIWRVFFILFLFSVLRMSYLPYIYIFIHIYLSSDFAVLGLFSRGIVSAFIYSFSLFRKAAAECLALRPL